MRQRCFNEIGEPDRLRGGSLCPTILRHNADGLSHSGRGQLKQAGKGTSKYITKGGLQSLARATQTTRNHWGRNGGDWGQSGLRRSYVYGWKVLAGVVGFEPTIFSTKNCCLTTWPHPISERRSSVSFGGAQEGLSKKPKLFPRHFSRLPKLLHQARCFPHPDQDCALPVPRLYGLMGSASL